MSRICFTSRVAFGMVCSPGKQHLQVPGVRGKATLPDLPYDYNALEPVISAEIMQLHHSKHHQAYVNNLNTALDKLAEAQAKHDFKTIISLEPAIRFNGGGHMNHSFFWQVLSPHGGDGPSGPLARLINETYGSMEYMQKRISALAVSVQGSGWAWLCVCPISGRLRSVATANQDPCEPTTGLIPIFGIDVWEHAYYLQYKNARPDYVNAIWKVANWKDIERRYVAGKPKTST